MARPGFETVDAYLAAQSDATRAALERVRAIIQRVIPNAAEGISYQIPAYRLNGAWAIYLAGYAGHYSLYPASESVNIALGENIAPYLAGKGTYRFPLSEPVPVKLIERIVRMRANELAASAQAKAAATKRGQPARRASPGSARSHREGP